MRPVSVMRGVAALRMCVGVVVTFATVPFLRATVRDEQQSGALVLFARTVGIRDFVFGAACLSAVGKGHDGRDVRRWLGAWLLSDLADVVAGMAATRHVGRSGAAAAAVVPLPFIAADVWMLRRLSGIFDAQVD